MFCGSFRDEMWHNSSFRSLFVSESKKGTTPWSLWPTSDENNRKPIKEDTIFHRYWQRSKKLSVEADCCGLLGSADGCGTFSLWWIPSCVGLPNAAEKWGLDRSPLALLPNSGIYRWNIICLPAAGVSVVLCGNRNKHGRQTKTCPVASPTLK